MQQTIIPSISVKCSCTCLFYVARIKPTSCYKSFTDFFILSTISWQGGNQEDVAQRCRKPNDPWSEEALEKIVLNLDYN